jgi:hypothetical protein
MEGRTRSSRQKLPTPTALPTKSAVGYATTTTTTAKPKAAAAAVVGGVKNTKSPTTHVQVIAVRVGVVSETRHFGTVQACLLQGDTCWLLIYLVRFDLWYVMVKELIVVKRLLQFLIDSIRN